MAESAVFSLACKILSTIASPAFEKAYEKGLSIWEARDDLAKLRVSIETIQAVLLDAEKKQQGSAAVKNWIKRLKGVLYDAEDLFDEVFTDDLLKQQMIEGNNKCFLKKVRVSCSKLNPIISRNSIAKKVKAIRRSLLDISTDMAQFEFVRCQNEEPMLEMRRGQDPGCFVDAKTVIGRDEDKKAILEMLFNESNIAESDFPVVIAIAGIGGMGKTTLAQLIYNGKEVNMSFEKRWFSCISDISGEREVLGKIFQSICGESCTNFNVSQLQNRIRESIEDKKYFLVLDDVWEDHRGRWQDRMSLLSGGAKGSRILVTTRLPSVVNAVCAVRVHNLEGLSEDDSWNLFKRLAFNTGYENDPRRESLGRGILKRCRRVPLAIWSIGSLLSEKNSVLEWEAIERENLPMLKDETMSVLKLSYDHLASNLKQCFAYCSLFPKNHTFMKHELIQLWIAQGYIEPSNEESDFMHLLRRGFFQEALEDDFGEIKSCKMHDIMHDLALHVAGDESITSSNTDTSSCTRHARVKDSIPAALLNVKRLRSCLLRRASWDTTLTPTTPDQLFTNFKLLRALSLPSLGIKNIPPSIGELKFMRYLNLSSNDFEELPDSITNLVNLLVLDLKLCLNLKVFPANFRKLIKLRYLNIVGCDKLQLMPVGIVELNHLQYLSNFKVGKGSEQIDALAGLQQQLRGKLSIEFRDGDECNWQLPVSVQQLDIWWYPGIRISDWGNNVIGRTNNLAHLRLDMCKKVKYLPSLRCLPNLRRLDLHQLSELEFLEEEENSSFRGGDGSIFFPRLKELKLMDLPKLKRWWRKVASAETSSCSPQFPLLSQLVIYSCPNLELKAFPQCPNLRTLHLGKVGNNEQLLPSTILCSSTLQGVRIQRCKWLSSLQLTSPELQTVEIYECDELVSFELLEAPSLRVLRIQCCKRLKILHIAAHLNALERLTITECPELELHPFPSPEKLPHFLRHCRFSGQLKITEATIYYRHRNLRSGPLDPYTNVSCTICGGSTDDHRLLLCDRCDAATHTYCVGLGGTIPQGGWFCQECACFL